MGKSSLLDALTLLLSPEFDLYHFVRDDFWFPRATSRARAPFAYYPDLPVKPEPGRHRVRRFRPLQRCWVPCDDGYHRVFYRPEGELADDDSVMTLRSFIDGEGEALAVEDIDDLAETPGASDAGAAPCATLALCGASITGRYRIRRR